MICVSAQASAQEARATSKSVAALAVEATKQTLLDPTTYAPAGLLYVSSRLDWDSSQAFYAHGDLEENPRFTITGRPHDTPLSYGDGNIVLLKDALTIASGSIVHNVVSHFTVDVLVIRHPEHAKLWKTLGWIERVGVGLSISYVLSSQHFEQWQTNKRLAAERGY